MKYNYTYNEWSVDTREIAITCQRQLTSDEVIELSGHVDYRNGDSYAGALDDGEKYKVTFIETDYGSSEYKITGDEVIEPDKEEE